MKCIKSSKIDIAPVNKVDCSGLGNENIKYIYIMDFSINTRPISLKER